MNLITLDQANDHLRLDLSSDGNSPPDYSGDPQAAELSRKIEEATDIVLDYIASYVLRTGADWDEITVPPGIRAATLMVLAWLWDHRGDDETDQGAADGYLTRPVTSLLHRYRDPSLA